MVIKNTDMDNTDTNQSLMAIKRPTKNKSIVIRRKLVFDEIPESVKKETWIVQTNYITDMIADLTLNQQKILAVLLNRMQPSILASLNKKSCQQLDLFNQELFYKETVDIVVPMKEFHIGKNHYDELKRDLFDFSDVSVEFKTNNKVTGKNSIVHTHLFKVILPSKYERDVCFVMDRDVFAKFIDTTQLGYTRFILEDLMKLKNTFEVRLYEKCCRWLNAGGFSMTMSELRKELFVEDKYLNYKDFNRWILKKSQKDLEAYTRCWYDYTPIYRDGEKEPYRIDFKIKRNVYDREEEEYINSKLNQLKNLMFLHDGFEEKDFKQIEELLTLYNADGAVQKYVDMSMYVSNHSSEIKDRKKYILAGMLHYLKPSNY